MSGLYCLVTTYQRCFTLLAELDHHDSSFFDRWSPKSLPREMLSEGEGEEEEEEEEAVIAGETDLDNCGDLYP